MIGDADLDGVRDLLPRRHGDIDVAGFDTAFVVFDPRCMQVHLIDGFGAVVFDACDGETPRKTLLDEVCDVTGWDRLKGEAEVEATLGQLMGLGLLEGTTSQGRPP
jgi:hypothetical protein